MPSPEIIFGTASIGASFTTMEDLSNLVKALRDAHISHLDTAGRYPPNSPGMSQKLLGDAQVANDGFTIDTKINVAGADAGGSLSSQSIEKSITESLSSLGVQKVNILYCHAPDYVTPLEEQAAAFDKHYRLKQFDYLGISNFKPEMIDKWMQISNENGYIKPSFYQGQYNLFFRECEKTLFPTLHKYGMHFTAFRNYFADQNVGDIYSPLAGGFLTGKLASSTKTEDLAGTRFEPGNVMGRAFRHWYDKPSMYKGLEFLQSLCKVHNIATDEAALRWLIHHSVLEEGDGVILGASKVSQVSGNTAAISHGPLPDGFVEKLNELWQIVKD